ncbi:MAG: malto-oligosyltrehalose synthase [Thermodesulfovibrionales bacterium]|jgi:(1->4)-alpha-D-glucan 1-alpha-D-glucosylmutase
MKGEFIPVPRIPVATYRLQFNHGFGFSEAGKILEFLHELGITDIYASPYFRARKGSLHGYDIVDPNALNSEVGTEQEYDEFVSELKLHGMGQILDIVPNHMCIDSDNPWWIDVLENGPSSYYAEFFDIDWSPAVRKLTNKILLPILGDQYGKVLERQELQLSFEEGSFFIYYYDNKLPILHNTYIFILQHRIDDLKNIVATEDPHFIELLSIITALRHLPPYTEKDPERIAERHREKEIITKRLLTLCDESPEIKAFLDENVRIFNGIRGDQKSFNLLDELLREQVWRLSYWRVAAEEINFRRFFDINNIAATRMEDPRVFEETHRLILQLISEGKVTGLRIDHPDGLYDPAGYFKRLQRCCFVRRRTFEEEGRGKGNVPSGENQADFEPCQSRQYDEIVASEPQFKPFYVIGEKILTKGEKLPDDWPIFGTTGYVFLNSLNGIFVEPGNAKSFDKVWSRFIKANINFQDIVYEKKKLVMQVTMSGEISTLGHFLNTITEKNRHTRDFTLNSLTRAIVEVIACFPIYRTYINAASINDRDRQYIEPAISKAKRKNPAISSSLFDFLKEVLLLEYPEEISEENKREWLDFIMKFQQVTSPVMAKGIEDTAFYIYNRMVSLNEVGGNPERFGTPLDTFHGQNIERNKYWPHALIATSTHDTKRSEDVRARINVLSEIPEKWSECLIRWSRLNKKKKTVIEGQDVPDRNEEYLLYQTLIGAWPNEAADAVEYEVFKKRIRDYMVKAIREAKVNTSWISPNTAHEEAAISFIDAIMDNTPSNTFLKDLKPFQKMISHYGMLNSLSQTLLKITSPGVPDFYQGTELWDFSLVDPDNRRPVDYRVRSKLFDQLKKSELEIGPLELSRKLTTGKDDGRIKLYLIYKALTYRRENRALFEKGEYIPLEAGGVKAENVCAFSRRAENSTVLVATPRFFTKLIQKSGKIPLGKAVWNDSVVLIPFETPGAPYRNLFTGETVKTLDLRGITVMYFSDVFSSFPVALMARTEE